MAAHGELDLAALTAIDVHVHVESDGHGHCALDDELMDASAAYTKRSWEMSKAAGDEKSAILKKNGMTVTAGPPAVISAILDALAPYGVTDIELPATPEREQMIIRPSAAEREAARNLQVGTA